MHGRAIAPKGPVDAARRAGVRVIGIFDSGSGGLTVLGAVRARLPDQSLAYLGDHGHAPYGPRSPAEITGLTRAGVAAMFDRGCRLVVLACNTASAIALRPLQERWLAQQYPDRRLLGVFVPIIEALSGRAWDRDDRHADPAPRFDLAVFATPATVASGAFGREIARRLPNVRVWEQGCPDLVALIEDGAGEPAIEGAVARAVAELRSRCGTLPGRVVLGCTHYPLVRGVFEAALPGGTEILDQPAIVADSLARYLDRRPAWRMPAPPDGAASLLLTTGDPAKVAGTAARLTCNGGPVLATAAGPPVWHPA